jgi:hypothetical protein
MVKPNRMKEIFEFRIDEDFANRLFRPDEGKKLSSGIVRLIRVPGDDPRLSEIGNLQKQIHRECGRAFFFGWDILRKYSIEELEAASLFHLKITSTFEPAGEECETKYDPSTASPCCGAGAKQAIPLFLDLKRIPKSKDISRTIAGEIVVSRRVFEIFARHAITGIELSPVRSNQSSSVESTDWFQFTVPKANADIVAPTRVGIDPFDDDDKGEYRCPLGDLIGLNLLSEVSIKSTSLGDADIICSRQFVGVRRGLLRPENIILVSPEVRRLIESEKLKGFEIEVAHLA